MTAAIRVRPRSASRVAVAGALLGAVLAAALLAAGARPAAAASPTNLRAQLTDDVGALSASERSAITAASDRLLRETGVQLWTWFIDTTGSFTAGEFASQTAARSSLGGTDFLLVVALDDRAYGYWTTDAVPLSNAQIEGLLSADLEPGLRAGDEGGAVVQLAGALASALGGAPATTSPAATAAATPASQPADGGGGTGGGGDGGLGTILAIIIVLVVIAGVGWFLLVRRRWGVATGVTTGGRRTPGASSDPLANLSDRDLNAEANRLLLATDDAIRDSEQELGFAQAQFGDVEAAPFGAALAAAKEDLTSAFAIRQALDDATPEDRPTRRRMLEDLARRCQAAQQRLDAESGRFEELRAFQLEAPGILAGLPAAAGAVEARLPAVEATLARLREYADASWQPVAANVDEARTRIAVARAAVAEGGAAAPEDTAKVAAAARVGQEALGQATAFLDAVERLAKDLDAARDRVSAEIADAEADLARARAAAAGTSPPDPAVAGRLSEAEGLLAAAREDLGHPKPDVAAAYGKARRANEIADEVLADIRTAAEQQAALAARLDTSVRGAQATVTRAADYVATRRGGVGGEARTRIAEAQRHLDAAVAAGAADPAAGIREAETAARLANEALSLAQRDYSGWDDPWHGGHGGGGGSGGSGGDIAGAIIGGIIGGLLAGGGRGGGGLGGLPGGRGGGLGGLGGGWGGGGRSGGGSFGGGSPGGRSGGGRW